MGAAPTPDNTPRPSAEKKADSAPKREINTIEVMIRSSGELQLSFSEKGAPYSRHTAQKILKAKPKPGDWLTCTVREGTVLQFCNSGRKPLTKPIPLRSLDLQLVLNGKTVEKILVQNMVRADGKEIPNPAQKKAEPKKEAAKPAKAEKKPAPKKAAGKEEAKKAPVAVDPPPLAEVNFGGRSLMNYDDIKIEDDEPKDQKPVAKKSLPGSAAVTAAAEALKPSETNDDGTPKWVYNRNAGEAGKVDPSKAAATATTGGAATGWEPMKHSPSTEVEVVRVLKRMNTQARERIMAAAEKNRRSIGSDQTKYELYLFAAKAKYKGDPTPVCRLLELHARPDYIEKVSMAEKARNSSTGAYEKAMSSANQSAQFATAILDHMSRNEGGAAKKFAEELLEKTGYRREELIGVAEARQRSVEELTERLNDPRASMTDQQIIMQEELAHTFSREFKQMTNIDTDGGKKEAIAGLNGLIKAAKGSKGMQACTPEMRKEINGKLDSLSGRIRTYARDNTQINIKDS